MTHDIDTLDAIIADLSGSLKIAEEVRNAQEREIGRLVTKVMELEREIRLPCGHVKRVRELETERDALEAEVVKLKDWNYGLRARCEVAEAEVERIKGDRAGWAARSKEQFDRIGVALERVREHRESGEPARDDATEVEALVEKVIYLEIEYRTGGNGPEKEGQPGDPAP